MLNRSAIVVKPRQPFLDWLHNADPTSHRLTLRDLTREPTIYLIPECDTEEDVQEVLRELCEEIFVAQLAGLFRDEQTWPRDLGFDVFWREIDPEPKGDGGVSDKTGWEGGGQQLGTRIDQEKQMCAGTPERVYIVWGC